MSTVYNLEPPTKGKVVLHTTLGDVEIELWPKEAPKAVRNFCQLCMEGYYDGTIFHRAVKDFLVQGGDPTGEGQGGESIYGRPFKDEFHSRLRFTHRGLVACANSNKPDTNGSQFFITLERCEHLDRKNTVFGRVAGDTIFNVVRIGYVEVDDADRPVDPPRILSTDVIMPPFDDILPRTSPAEIAAKAQAQVEAQRAAAFAERKKKGKALTKLSFGDEAEEDEQELEEAHKQLRFRSAHETTDDDRRLEKVEPGAHDAHIEELQKRLAQEQRERHAKAAQRTEPSHADAVKAIKEKRHGAAIDAGSTDFAGTMLEKAQARAQSARDARGAEAGPRPSIEDPEAVRAQAGPSRVPVSSDDDDSAAEADAVGPSRKVDKLSMSKVGRGADAKRKAQAEVVDAELLTAYQLSLAKFKQQKRAKGSREQDMMSRLKQFTTMLKTKAPAPAAPEAGSKDASAQAGKHTEPAPPSVAADEPSGGYDGKVNKTIDHKSYLPAAWRIESYIDEEDDEGDDFANLRGHKLVWDRNDRVADPNKRRDDVNDFVVVDPLLEAGKAKFNKQQHFAKKRQNEWAGKANL